MRTPTTPFIRLVSPGPPRLRGVVTLVALSLAAAGCRDAPTDPMVGLVAEEAYAALALGVSFPDPTSWAGDDLLAAEAEDALNQWRKSWDLPPDEGRRAREAIYAPLAEGLQEVLAPEVLQEELVLLSEGVLRAQALVADALPNHLAVGIQAASSSSLAAREARARGDYGAAVEALVRGGDALREVGPEAVARALQSEAEARLGRVSEDDPYSVEDLERLQRLVRGGRQALDEKKWGLAIRRAFYAKGLLDGNG